MKDVRIRTAQLSDLDAIVDLNYGLFQEDAGQRDPFMNLEWPLEGGNKHFTHHITTASSLCLVAEVDSRIVGYLVGYVGKAENLRPIKPASLESMFVVRELRSQGVGQALVEAFLQWCSEQEAERVSVNAYASNYGATRFYQRLGFAAKDITLERPV